MSSTHQAEEADVIVLNTCVVRQSAEDKAYGRLYSLKPLKEKHPNLVINLMGCLVGVKGHEQLKEALPICGCVFPALRPGSADCLPDPGRKPAAGSKTKPRTALL